MNKKNTGSYYTPEYLASFITERVLNSFGSKKAISILEPSVGDGSFVSELVNKKGISIKLSALDINKEELLKAEKKWKGKQASFIHSDFLKFSSGDQFHAVIGNPPYVKKNLLSKEQIELCDDIHNKELNSAIGVKNIWTSFVLKSTKLLRKDGVLAFVLPSELLQVKFAEEIREYLKSAYQRIEIFTFNDLMFECKGQDTVVLIAYKKHLEQGEYFANIDSAETLLNQNFILKKNNILVDSKVKWTHHFLSDEDLSFIESLRNRLQSVNDYCESKPGIVTAANDFFIISKEKEKQFNLSKFTKPIIQKGLFVNGSVVFDKSNMEQLEKKNLPTKFLHLTDETLVTKGLSEYLAMGELRKLQDRYKCKQRKNWYVVPNVSTVPQAFFFKRSHLYPKLLKNNSDAFVTDSAYKIEMKKEYDVNSFIYSFYNSLTLLFAEIEGRYYGGGVLELTPSEFKKIPLPYNAISETEFETFTTNFENKENIDEILQQNDSSILKSALGLDLGEITKIREIRRKLLVKRMRSH